MPFRHDANYPSDALEQSASTIHRDRPSTSIHQNLSAIARTFICRQSPRTDARAGTLCSRIGGYGWCFALSAVGSESALKTRKSFNLHANVEFKTDLQWRARTARNTFRESERLYVAIWSCSDQAGQAGRGDKDLC